MKPPTLLFAFVSLVACSKPPRPQAHVDPRNIDGPVDCAPEELKANERCFAKAQEACDSLSCAEGCDIHRSRASKWVTCALQREHSSMFTRCGGYSNWQCPEKTICVEPGGRDSLGRCAATNGQALARCEGFAGWSCPEGTVCAQDPRAGACNRDKDDDCEGICVTARP